MIAPAVLADEVAAYVEGMTFQEGLNEFARTLHKYRSEYLAWPEIKGPVAWIYDNIAIPKTQTSRAGNMKLTVYQRLMAECVVDPSVRQVTVLKGVQIGYSKALKAIYAYVVAYLSKNAAVAFPTKRDVARFWKDEIADMYTDMEVFRKIVREVERGKAQDTWYEQRFLNGVRAYFRAAFNEDDLQSFTSWLNMADEVDRSGWLSGKNGQGDKLAQFRNRGTDFVDSKTYVGSTPGLRHLSIVWKEWQTSDKRRLQVHCPHCNHRQELRWTTGDEKYGFRWDLDKDGRVEAAYYRCAGPKHCRIDEDVKDDMIDAGEYEATEVATVPGNVGIHIPSWLSPAPGAAWRILAQEWLNAQDDPEKLKEFYNFKMAEPWDEFISQSIAEGGVSALRRPYPAEVPDDVVVITIGGDDQTNKEGTVLEQLASREIAVVGWNRRRKPRVIGHWVIPGEVGDPDADAAYEFFIRRPYLKRDGTAMYVQATAMDMGGHHPDETRIFAGKFEAKMNVFAVRGSSQIRGKRLVSIWPSGFNVKTKGKKKLLSYTVDSQSAKDRVAEMLLAEGDDAAMFPAAMPDSYFPKLLCEQRTLQPNGGYYWHPKKGERADEEWMCLVYAYAALEGLRALRPRWRDLNLAARNAGIPDIMHDPETGEIGYEGQDLSIPALQFEIPGLVPDMVLAHSECKAERASAEKRKMASGNPVAAKALPIPGSVQEQTVIKKKPRRRPGGVIW
jgi:phage terminase large subunit GpA-like protein